MRLASFLVLLIPLLVFVTVGDAKAQFRCPAGTEVVGSPPPDGTELFCAKGQKGATIKHGPYRSWYERGGAKKIEGNFTNGEKDGLFTTWYDRAGKMRREVFVKGYRHGKAEMWYKNGQPRLSEEFENGKKHGTRRGWYKDGNPSYHIEVSHGRNVGAFQQWYRQNKRKIAGFFDTESKKTGIWTIWDKQGQRVSEGPYVAGKREGKWTFWSNDGSIHGVTHFKAGKIVRTTIPDYNADKRDKNGKKIKRKKGVKDSKRKPRGRKTSDETPKNSRRIGESDEIDLDDESLKESSPDDVENKAEREELDDLETPIPPLPERNEAAEKKNDERYSYDGMVQELRERQKKIEERDRELQEKMKVTDDEMESEETKPDSADVAGTNAEMEVNDSDAATDSAPKQEAKDSEEKSAADESN